MGAEEIKAAAAEYSHRAVWPLLVADKVVGGKHHLADITVKAGFMPVLRQEKKNLNVISHTSGQHGKEGIHADGLYLWCGPFFSISYKNDIRSAVVLCSIQVYMLP